jgi:general secretion pathway protein K
MAPARAPRFTKDQGAALILVLTVVAFMGLIAVVAAEAVSMGARRVQNQTEQAQTRWYLLGAEIFALGRIEVLLARSPEDQVDQSEWQARPFAFPLDEGAMTLRLFDGGNCFNLNSLVTVDEGGEAAPNSGAQVQFARLIDLVGVRGQSGVSLAAAATDWIDADSVVSPGGAEDEFYSGRGAAYRPANAPFADVSELTRVAGFTQPMAAALAPHVCVRPGRTGNAINPNTLLPGQGVVLSALLGQGLPLASAEALIRARPRGGWPTLEAFFRETAMTTADPSEAARALFSLRTRYFVLAADVAHRDARESGAALIDAAGAPRIVRRVFGVKSGERVL